MSKWIIVPAANVDALCGRKYAPTAKDAREAALPLKSRELWGLYAVPVKDGRRAIPADVVLHPAYAAVVAELKSYTAEELTAAAFPDPPLLVNP